MEVVSLKLKDFSLRIEAELLQKLHYVAKSEDRSANGEILQLIRKRVQEFEKEHGVIETEETK